MLIHRCMHCLAANSCEVRFDKKGRPFTSCSVCWTKSFFHSIDSLRGVAVAPLLIENALQQRAKDPKFAAWFDGEIAKIMKQLHDRTLAPMPEGARPVALKGASGAPPAVPFEVKVPA